MGLVPGTISNAPSSVDEQARKLSLYIKVLLYALVVVGLLRLFSLSIWSTLGDLFMVLYGYYVFKRFFDAYGIQGELLVFVETTLCFTVVTSFQVIFSIFSLINLVTGKQEFYDKLRPWQIICGLVFGSLEIVVYFGLIMTTYLLYRNLRRNHISINDEHVPFMSGGTSNSGMLTGTYATIRQPAINRQPASTRFPGKGYKLDG